MPKNDKPQEDLKIKEETKQQGETLHASNEKKAPKGRDSFYEYKLNDLEGNLPPEVLASLLENIFFLDPLTNMIGKSVHKIQHRMDVKLELGKELLNAKKLKDAEKLDKFADKETKKKMKREADLKKRQESQGEKATLAQKQKSTNKLLKRLGANKGPKKTKTGKTKTPQIRNKGRETR